MRLLIVEDEVRLADTLRQLLNRQGYTADVYYDGVSGLDNATTGIYDLMVLDVMLPGMNGFQVVKKLREAGVTTPVLMLTAKTKVRLLPPLNISYQELDKGLAAACRALQKLA